MLLCRYKITIFIILLINFNYVFGVCKETYITRCDNVADIKESSDVSTWTRVIIGSETDNSPKESLNLIFYDSLGFYKLHSLTILNRINRLEQNVGLYCKYRSKYLKELILYGNDLEVIRKSSMYLGVLARAVFVNNNIKRIESYSLPKTEYLDLSNNKLEDIQKDVINLDILKVLIIKNNKLTHIANGALPSTLQILNLENNELKYIQESVLKNLTNLTGLTLSRNKFTEVPNLHHLKQIKVLDLSHNLISTTDVDTFAGLSNLEILDISHNKIQYHEVLNPFFLRSPQQYLRISIAFNRLFKLNINQTLENMNVILYGNPWHCEELLRFEKFLANVRVTCDKKNFNKGPYCLDPYPLYANESGDEYFECAVSHPENYLPCNFNSEKPLVLNPPTEIAYCVL